jgi:hypothetical protein
MKKFFFSLVLALSIPFNVYSAETLSELSEDTLPVLNEVLRSLEIDRQLSIANSLNLRSKKIENLATPTANTDATTKAYVDDYVSTYVASHSSTSVFIGTLNASTVGNKSITGLGFQPTAIIFIWGPTSTGETGSSGIGFMTSSNQYSVESHSINANWGGSSSATAILGGTGITSSFAFDYVSMDSDGFTVNVSDATTDTTVFYLAIK